jgi:hypothetical protein
MTLYSVLYKSVATHPGVLNTHTVDIVKQSMTNKDKAEVTGFLHHEHGGFYQYIEGKKDYIETLLAKIRRDPRHFGMTILSCDHREHRLFPDFEMGFSRAHGRTIADRFYEDANIPGPAEVLTFLCECRDILRQHSPDI